MALSFLGHSPSFEIWVFNVNGREFVARNFSKPSPLQLKFVGVFDKYSGGAPLIKTSGFNITDSTDKVIVWTWAGKQYTSYWMSESDDIDDPDANTTLLFGPAVPYSGPPVAPVGTGVTNTQSPPPPSIPTPVPSLPIDQGGPIVSGPQLPTPPPVYQPEPAPIYRPTPAPQPPVVVGPMASPVVTPPTAPSVSTAGTDWVKLGLQLGAAYLLLS